MAQSSTKKKPVGAMIVMGVISIALYATLLLKQDLPQQSRAGPQGDEDQGKPQDEQDRVEQDGPSCPRVGHRPLDLVKGDPGNEGNVRRKQRQNARR